MRDKIQAFVTDLDNRYQRVKLADVVVVDDCDSTNDFYRSVCDILARQPRGSYRKAFVYYPNAEDLIGIDTPDEEVDAAIDAADKLLNELANDHGWEIPEGDPLGENLLSLVMTGYSPG